MYSTNIKLREVYNEKTDSRYSQKTCVAGFLKDFDSEIMLKCVLLWKY